jgi:hypothetical protein
MFLKIWIHYENLSSDKQDHYLNVHSRDYLINYSTQNFNEKTLREETDWEKGAEMEG